MILSAYTPNYDVSLIIPNVLITGDIVWRHSFQPLTLVLLAWGCFQIALAWGNRRFVRTVVIESTVRRQENTAARRFWRGLRPQPYPPDLEQKETEQTEAVLRPSLPRRCRNPGERWASGHRCIVSASTFATIR
jgi:hypothetical protein